MANIVVTGSTRGIGLGLVREFRRLGHNVVVTSRGADAVAKAVSALEAMPGTGKAFGQACDVADRDQVQALWDKAAAALGRVDIWINNAGLAGPRKPLAEMTRTDIAPVLDANFWGMVWGVQVPLAGMMRQGGGKIFTFEGFGSDGMTAPGFSIYGSTKRALTYFTKTVNKEITGSPVILGTISPGIVITDLIEEARDADPDQWEKTKKLYNILADKVETVTPWLADQVLAANGPAPKIRWLTKRKAAWRFASQWAVKRNVMG
jgi:NAD(P)-dependent dehydrogenase (short-subunit alcohol dehydrogenase family)